MSTLTHTEVRLAEAPALLVHDGRLADAARRGAILFFHGLGASKEAHAADLEPLAERGFLAVGVDNYGHGARAWEMGEVMAFVARVGWQAALLEGVRRTVAEVPRVVDALAERAGGLGPLGVAGVSMGGFVAYGAVLAEPRVRVCTPILGSPEWFGAADSPHRRPEAFARVALLAQNAGRDTTVPPRAARAFHEALRPHFRAAPERLAYLEYPDSPHHMREQDWRTAARRALAWYERHLVDAAPALASGQ